MSISAPASVFQGVQVGVETTSGTKVAADKKLQSISIAPAIQNESDAFRPMGSKWPTVVAQNREWVEAAVEGRPTYDEIIYLLSSVLTEGAVTQPDATNAPSVYLWTFDPTSDDEDSPVTFTVEQGFSGRAARFGYGIVSALDLNVSRGELTLGGSMLGQRLEDDVTLTADPTSLPLIPVLSKDVDVYLAEAVADLGTAGAKLDLPFHANTSLGDRYGPVWALNTDFDSFISHVETEPSGQLALNVAKDAEGMGILPHLRSGDTRFLRVEAVGEVIEDVQTYRMTLDLALKCTDVGGFEDEDGVATVEWTFDVVHDDGWGRALLAEVINTQASLS